MPNTDHFESPIVRASRVHVRLERAFARLGITTKRGCAGVDPLGEPVIDVGVIGAADGERLADALGEPEDAHAEARAPASFDAAGCSALLQTGAPVVSTNGLVPRLKGRFGRRDRHRSDHPHSSAVASCTSNLYQATNSDSRWPVAPMSYECPDTARLMPWARTGTSTEMEHAGLPGPQIITAHFTSNSSIANRRRESLR